MKSMKALGGGLGVAALALASTVVQADAGDNFGTVTGNIGVASEYIFRGLPSSASGAQVQGGLDWSKDMYYVGAWLSNTGNGDKGNEVNLYGGLNIGDFDLGLLAYAYPADIDRDGSGEDTGGRGSKLLEIYAGYNHGPFSGYAWYGVGAYSASDDDYVYLEGSITGAISETADVALHVGHHIYLGDDFNAGGRLESDNQTDVGLKVTMGGFWAGITTILDNDTNAGEFKRPRINVGYNWTFDNVLDVKLN